MKATETYFNNFLETNKTVFAIPVYQRNYSWEKEHCMKLLSDIFNIGCKDNKQLSHFIGSIVYILGNTYSNANLKELLIIDGQQRITTITLIYLRIFKLAQEMKDDYLIYDINENYLINKLRGKRILKLKLTENDSPALDYIYESIKNYDFKEPSRIIENYNFFEKVINKDNYEKVIDGLKKLFYIDIALDEYDKPQRIFESLNSTGLDLSQADLIRNYILMGLSIENQNEIYKNYWQVIEKLANDNGKSQISDFFRDYLTLKYKNIPVINKVYATFKIQYPTIVLNDLLSLLSELKSLVKFYNKILNPSNEDDIDISLQLNYLKKIKITVAYPFLMQVYKDYYDKVIDKQDFIRVLELIQSYAWRRFILGFGTEGRNKIFMSLYDKVDKNNYLFSIQKALLKLKGTGRFPRNTEVINALHKKDVYNIKKQNIKYFLNRLEQYQNNEYVNIDNNPKITIEHIFPQNPNADWKVELGNKDYNILKEDYLHTIANLTYSGNNSKLGNKIFSKKRDLENAGYKDSRLWLNKYLSTIEKFGSDEIKERFEIIADRFLKIWTFPNIIIDDKNIEEINIFDAETPKSKKLEYAIFFGEKIVTSQFIKLYVEIFKYLFNKQNETFFVTDLGESIKLTDDKKKLVRAHKISKIYYIEGCLDNETKFERIKKALKIFRYEDALTIKYAKLKQK